MQSLDLWRATKNKRGLFWCEYDSVRQFLNDNCFKCQFAEANDLKNLDTATLLQLFHYDKEKTVMFKFIISVSENNYVDRTFFIEKDAFKTFSNLGYRPNFIMGSRIQNSKFSNAVTVTMFPTTRNTVQNVAPSATATEYANLSTGLSIKWCVVVSPMNLNLSNDFPQPQLTLQLGRTSIGCPRRLVELKFCFD